jgi:hypothetical protein
MVPQNDATELAVAWHALSEAEQANGWRTIPIFSGFPCTIMAGRHFPGNEEALVFRFRCTDLPPVHLPVGVGFSVSRPELTGLTGSGLSIALCRQPDGNRDLFMVMAADVVATIRALTEADDRALLRAFILRITAWQEFMRRTNPLELSAEAEVGLWGELHVLETLLDAGMSDANAIECWQGPLDALHDFECPLGAIEVKTSVTSSGEFRARIGSLDQLDTSVVHALFVAAIRIKQGDGGSTLDQKVSRVEARLGNLAVKTEFRNKLIHAGHIISSQQHHKRTFVHTSTTYLPVTSGFPRLTFETVPIGVRAAHYDISLNLEGLPSTTLNVLLDQIGILR